MNVSEFKLQFDYIFQVGDMFVINRDNRDVVLNRTLIKRTFVVTNIFRDICDVSGFEFHDNGDVVPFTASYDYDRINEQAIEDIVELGGKIQRNRGDNKFYYEINTEHDYVIGYINGVDIK